MKKNEYDIDLTYLRSQKRVIKEIVFTINRDFECDGKIADLNNCLSNLQNGSILHILIDDISAKKVSKVLDIIKKTIGKNAIIEIKTINEIEGIYDDFDDEDEIDDSAYLMKKGCYNLHYINDLGEEVIEKKIKLEKMRVKDFIYGILDCITKKDNSKHDYLYLEHISSKEKYYNDGLFTVKYIDKNNKIRSKKINVGYPISSTELKEEIKNSNININNIIDVFFYKYKIEL